jgi:DNA polymerase-3 subunit beta
MQFSIKQSQLKAMLNLAAKQDIRYYLNGVFVEFNQQTTRLIATDGHKLGVLNHSSEDNQGAGSLIIPREVIENLPKSPSRAYDPELTITKCPINHASWTIVIPGGTQIVFQQIDGVFPDYRRVCQFTTDGTVANFNYEYLVQFLKVQHALGGSKGDTLNLYQNGNSSALVHLEGVPNFVGVIMPMRNGVSNQEGAKVSMDFLNPLNDTGAPAVAAA